MNMVPNVPMKIFPVHKACWVNQRCKSDESKEFRRIQAKILAMTNMDN
jgi:hypothetical protein